MKDFQIIKRGPDGLVSNISWVFSPFHPSSDDIPSDAEAEFRLHQGGTEEPQLKVSEDEEDEEEEVEGASYSVTEGNSFPINV